MKVTPVQQAEVLLAIQRALPSGMQVRHAGIGNPGTLEFNVWDQSTNSAVMCSLAPKDIAKWTGPSECDCGWACDLSDAGTAEIPAHALAIAEALRDIILRTCAAQGHA